jgi:GNAT superfamily N-acetyltransferase
MQDLTLLRRIDAYLDAVPRTACRTETIGPFTVFLHDAPGWRYYARPTPGVGNVTADDVRRVRARQREAATPEAFEWVRELVPAVAPAARETGLEVRHHALMRLVDGVPPTVAPVDAEIRLATTADDLARISAVQYVAFADPGTETGHAGTRALDAIATATEPGVTAFLADRIRRELTITAAAFVDGEPVAAGAHQPVGDVTEIVGVACLPAFRRRGLGAAVTAFLVRDALRRGIALVCLSADDAEVERLYGRLGFVTVGAVGSAEPRSI